MSAVDKAVLIDDSEIDLFIQRRFLELFEFSRELITYSSAEEALKWLKNLGAESPPRVIFLDLNMPGIDGFSFLRLYKTLPERITSSCKIVVLTSSNNLKDRETALVDEHVIQYITKPLKKVDVDELKKLF